MLRRRKTMILGISAAVAAASVVAVTTGASGSSPAFASATTRVARAHYAEAVATPLASLPIVSLADEARLFPVLQQPPGQSESAALVSAAQSMAAAGQHLALPWVANAGGVRTVYSSATTTVGIFPATNGVCTVAITTTQQGGAGGCTPMGDAEAHGITIGFQDQAGYNVVGILPAGWTAASAVTATGAVTPLALTPNNAYVLVAPAEPAAVVYTDPTGATQTVNLASGVSQPNS